MNAQSERPPDEPPPPEPAAPEPDETPFPPPDIDKIQKDDRDPDD